jgi:hypothetical protein
MSALDNMTIVGWERDRLNFAPDITIECHGSIDLFRPLTRAGREWLAANTPEGDNIQYFGSALAVEPRYALNLINGMTNDGLILQ